MPIGPRLATVLTGLALALALVLVPAARVAACSCAMGETTDAIRAADLAFVGTVVDQRSTGGRPDLGDEEIEYAFAVDRASIPTPTITTVRAGNGGASCGITFARGESWLIIAQFGDGGPQTSLCAGNRTWADLGEEERQAVTDLLAAAPTDAAPESDEGADLGGLAVPVFGIAALLLLAGVGWLAFRREVA